MGFFDFLQRKESATGRMLVTAPGQPAWSNRDYASFAFEGYSKNVVAYQAINKVAESVASVKPKLLRGDTEVADPKLLALIERPNPAQSWREFTLSALGFYQIAGNLFTEAVVVGGSPREMYNLRPDRTKVITGSDGFPRAYRYEIGGNRAEWPVDLQGDVLRSDVMHWKSFHPTDDWYGLSPVEAGAYSIDQHNESMGWMQALLQNSATPSGAVVAAETLPDDAYNRLKVEMEEKHQGAKNAGRPMLLEGGLDWKQMGLSPDTMKILDSKNSSARDVCLAFGVPPQLLGIPGDNTYANYKEARLALYEDTVLPLAELYYAALSRHLGQWFEPFEMVPDRDKIDAIVEKRYGQWESIDKLSTLTKNEKREKMGLEAVEGGDAFDTERPLEEPDAKAMAIIAGYAKPA